MNHRKKLVAAATAVALVAAAPMLIAQEKKAEPGRPAEQAETYRPGRDPGPGYGMGPGMMSHEQWHERRMAGPGPGCDMGPGMPRGHPHGADPWQGMGPGNMGRYGGHHMGAGMMGGSGMAMMGPGMMPGPGGMGRMHQILSLDLSDEQADRIDGIHDDLHRKHRGLMIQMWEARDRLRELAEADDRDPAAIGKAYAQVSDLQRQMIESRVQAEKQMEGVLTAEQREQLKRDIRRDRRHYRHGR